MTPSSPRAGPARRRWSAPSSRPCSTRATSVASTTASGRGYPYRLTGEAIPLEARIVSVADTYDAMSSDRPYRKGLPASTALEEIARCAGSQFDPLVVHAFLRVVEARPIVSVPVAWPRPLGSQRVASHVCVLAPTNRCSPCLVGSVGNLARSPRKDAKNQGCQPFLIGSRPAKCYIHWATPSIFRPLLIASRLLLQVEQLAERFERGEAQHVQAA